MKSVYSGFGVLVAALLIATAIPMVPRSAKKVHCGARAISGKLPMAVKKDVA